MEPIQNEHTAAGWGHGFQSAAIEVLGQAKAEEWLPAAPVTLGDLGSFHRRMEQAAGEVFAAGIETRIGQAFFRYILNNAGESTRLFSSAVKFLPPGRKVARGLRLLLQLLSDQTGIQADLQDEGERCILRLDEWEAAKVPAGACSLAEGILREYMAWAGSGKVFAVEHTSCCKTGGLTCEFVLQKKPLE